MSSPRIVWISTVPVEKTPRGHTSVLASVRYRTIIPSAALQRLGCDSRITFLGPKMNRSTLAARFDGAGAVVVGKLLYQAAEYTQAAERVFDLLGELRARGTKVLADFCDDMFQHELRGPVDRRLANSVDAVVASTPQLAETMAQLTAAPITVITDPVEGRRGEPAAVPAVAAHPHLLWFGHPVNLDTLKVGLPELEARAATAPYSLVLVTAPGAGAEAIAAELNQRWRGSGRTCRVRAWSVEAVFDELRKCDAVVIPSDPYNPRKVVKSPNRFTESVWAGKPVLAHPLPAYEALAACGWVGADLGEGLTWWLEHTGEAAARILAGQALVAQRYSPEAVGAEWKTLLDGLR